MAATMLESSRDSPVTISPLKEVNLPRTLLTIMWRTENPISEWVGSIVQVPTT
jgi:hypothetical protein